MPELSATAAEIVDDRNVVVVAIGIEDYSYSSEGMKGVDFAKRDATEFVECIKQSFMVPDENVTLWINSDVTRTRLDNDLKYQIVSLNKNNTLIFYYAGHGFYHDGNNKITAWDTHPTNLNDTTICLNDILLKPLADSACTKALIFIDACSQVLEDIPSSRDMISSLNEKELKAFLHSDRHIAIFMASSPGESSYSCKKIGHGIWTYHLLKALYGEAEEALFRETLLTDVSLKDYLVNSVKDYITKETFIKKHQTPYAIIHSSNTFKILEIKENDDRFDWEELNLDIDNAYFTKIEDGSIKSCSEFKKGSDFVPKYFNGKTSTFVQSRLEKDVNEEVQQVRNNTKVFFNLKRREISVETNLGGANLNCDYFRMEWDYDQSRNDFGNYVITRKLILRIPYTKLPLEFDDLFPVTPDRFVIPITGDIDFDYIADQFEELSEKLNGVFDEGTAKEYISLQTSNRTTFYINIKNNELEVTHYRSSGVIGLLETICNEMSSIKELCTGNFLIEE